MAVILTCWILLLCINSIQSYNQLVIPGETQATASSLYSVPYFPNNTVDGNVQQQIKYCMHTKNEKPITEAWLRINLLKLYSIKQVKFWYRNDGGSGKFTIRLRGYSIRVSNDSNAPVETCYTDPGNVHLPTILENECVATSQYVWFYQTHTASGENSPILEICEVQIFGCETGRFGGNCTDTCDHCKNPATCGIERGECDDQGCAVSGFQPAMCVDCTQGLYGPSCSDHCSEFCKNDECDGKTGTCLHGCEDKWYGDRCVSPCGHCKNNDTCSQTAGICPHGCIDGYIGGICDTACSDGWFGAGCINKCGFCSGPDVCSNINGVCPGTCSDGYKGIRCKTPCQNGKYGPDCKRDCGFCDRPGVCLHTNGSCPGNCIAGYTGDRCVDQCTTGYYGAACLNRCGHCFGLDVCFHTNGSCPGNCRDGYVGEKCIDPCPHGSYGPHCKNKCGYCFATDVCSNTDGRCPGNCSDGFRGEKCSEPCRNGWYGPGCETPCGHCLGSDVCHHINGRCPGNCTDGYTGKTCSNTCDAGWHGPACQNQCGYCFEDDICYHINGSCPGISCPHGSYGPHCKNECGLCYATDVCLNTNGSCPGDCKDGFREDKCTDPCENGWYGSGCETPCGHCFGSDVCHHINGSCPGNCSEGYTGETCSNIVEQISSRHDKSQSSDFIAIPVAIIISIMVIVTIIIFLLRWKRQTLRQKLEEENVYYLPDIIKEEGNEYEELNNIEETFLYNNQQVKPENLQHSFSENTTKPIMIMDLWSAIHKLQKHSNIGFKREFESISSDVSECSCKAGKLRINAPKNRYATTLPYDHSRVVLSSNRNDYINANIIKNARGEPAYIATQGPTSNTMCEFWRMVWQEKISVIAMTTYHGNGYEDVNQYLPNSIARSVEKGNFLIQLMSDKTYSCFKIRRIQITCKETKEIRLIKHLEFTAWPKHGKPQPLEVLLYYHYVSRSMEECPENKLLVHCSSGTGPTAVIIALDALYKQGKRSGMISISKFVGEMRKDRMEMIQNVEQYICLHYVLYESFRATSYVQSRDTLLTDDKLSEINDELNILSSIRPSDVCFQNRQKKSKDSEYKNMISEGDCYRLDALDAVLQSSFTTRNIIIAGRYPNHGEAVDLIRLLTNHKCTTLVSINPLTEVPYSKEWYRQFGNLQNFQVEVIQGPKISEHIMLSTLRMKALSDVDWLQMTLYEITSWKFSEKVPSDVDAILDLIKFVQVDKHVAEKTKLVILSKDGATGCGVLCAVYNAIQQLQQDEEVDMFTIVRQLQSRRPEMICDLSEYLFSYQAVTQYIKGK